LAALDMVVLFQPLAKTALRRNHSKSGVLARRKQAWHGTRRLRPVVEERRRPGDAHIHQPSSFDAWRTYIESDGGPGAFGGSGAMAESS
jgi:hypothetical protein